MSVTVIAVPGAVNANSFTEVAVFDAYCNDRLNAQAGREASEDDKGRALIEATRELNTLQWVGIKASTEQALSWPREDAPIPDRRYEYFPNDVIPNQIVDACCELALQFLKAGDTDIASIDANFGVIRKKVDVLETQWADPAQQKQGWARFPRVVAMISSLLAGSTGNLEIVRT